MLRATQTYTTLLEPTLIASSELAYRADAAAAALELSVRELEVLSPVRINSGRCRRMHMCCTCSAGWTTSRPASTPTSRCSYAAPPSHSPAQETSRRSLLQRFDQWYVHEHAAQLIDKGVADDAM